MAVYREQRQGRRWQSRCWSDAAGEKPEVMTTMDYLRREAAAGRRKDFEKYLAASPDVPPISGDEL